MKIPTLDDAMEAVYTSLHQDNEDIDTHIQNLKAALTASGKKEALFESSRLPVQNRAGRKMMQSYFKKRGVGVKFSEES